MNHLKALVLMQLKDKIDLGFVKTRKTLIRKIVFTLLKFAAVAAATYVIRMLLGYILFSNSDTPQIMIVLITFLLGISFITCTVGLVKSLYYADDNRVLITFPVGNNVIFISKLIVYYFYELIREYSLIVPIIIGCGVFSMNILTFWFIPWTMFTMLFVPMLPVLTGALLSIPALYVTRFANRFPIMKIILFAVITGLCVWALAVIIGMLPEDIDLINQGATVIRVVKDFLLKFENAVKPAAWLVYLFTGKLRSDLTYNVFAGRTFLIFAGLLGVIAALFGIVYLVSRPLFFRMMSKSFEFEKKAVDREKLNTPHGKWYAFTVKELKLCILDTDVSLNFLAVYIAVPLLIFLLNKLYFAMDTRLKGQVMTYAFNLLIMLLPMLASNSVIAKLYSKEGRAGYMKKTKPIDILMPVTAKLMFFFVLSIPSVIATVSVFGIFVYGMFKWYDLVLLALLILCLQYGHILFSALIDIMNPQNEQYATVGDSVQNPNESKSTLVAFLISAFFAGFGYILLQETALNTGTVTLAIVKLFLIAAVFFGVMISLFIKSVRAYYYEK